MQQQNQTIEIMARIKNENTKKCNRCIFYNSCQNNPNTCEDFVDKKAETDDDKVKRRMGSSHSLHLMELGTYLLEQVQSLNLSFYIEHYQTTWSYSLWKAKYFLMC